MDECVFSSGELCLARAGNGAWPWAWTRPGLAAQQDPENAAIQKGYLGLFAELERYNQTVLDESSRVVERFPQNWEIAALHLRLLVGAEQWEPALETVNRLTDLLQGVGTLGPRKSEPLLEDHTAILRALDREQEIEGARAFWLSKRFAPRPVLAGTNQIDLTTFYNAALDDDWHDQVDRGNNLASLELDRTA